MAFLSALNAPTQEGLRGNAYTAAQPLGDGDPPLAFWDLVDSVALLEMAAEAAGSGTNEHAEMALRAAVRAVRAGLEAYCEVAYPG